MTANASAPRRGRPALRALLFAGQAALFLLFAKTYHDFVQPHRADTQTRIKQFTHERESGADGEPLPDALPLYTRGWVRGVEPEGFLLDALGGDRLRVRWAGAQPSVGGFALVKGQMREDGVAVADAVEVDPYYRGKLHVSLVALAMAAGVFFLRYRIDWRRACLRLRGRARGARREEGGVDPSGAGGAAAKPEGDGRA